MNELYNNDYLNKSTEFINHIKERSHSLLPIGNSEKKILEIGCGNGYDAITLALKNPLCQIIGIDINNDLILASRQNAVASQCKNVEFILSDAEKMPFPANSFDIIRAERVFQHLKNIPDVMTEISRVLKPKGTISIIETDWPGMDIYIEDHRIEKIIIEALCQYVLPNGNATRNILSYFKKADISIAAIELTPLIMTDYAVADALIKFDNIIEVALKNNLLTPAEKNRWEENINFINKQNSFNLTVNILIYSGIKF